MTALAVRELSAGTFAEFGDVVAQPERSQDASGPGWRWWAEIAQLPAVQPASALGYLRLEPAPARFDWAERHMRSRELIVPLDGGCLVYVGRAEHLDQPERMPALEEFQVFRVPAGQAVVLREGVWHGAPLADGEPLSALVLLRAGTGGEDTTVVRFPDTPVEIQHADR